MKKISYLLKCANKYPSCIGCGSKCYKNMYMSQKKTAKKISEIEFCDNSEEKLVDEKN